MLSEKLSLRILKGIRGIPFSLKKIREENLKTKRGRRMRDNRPVSARINRRREFHAKQSVKSEREVCKFQAKKFLPQS